MKTKFLPTPRLEIAVLTIVRRRDVEIGIASKDPRATLRKLYAPVWKPWTLVEAADKKLGAVSEKP